MNISKRSLILLIMCMLTPVLLGNDGWLNAIGIEKLVKVIYFGIPILYIISFVLDCIKTEEHKFKFEPLAIISILFILACLISIPFGINVSFNSFTNLIVMGYLIMYIYTIRIYSFEEKNMKLLLKWMLIVLLIVSIVGIIQYIFKIELISIGIDKYPGAIGRIYSTTANATHLDKYLLYNMLIIFYLMYKNKIFNKLYYVGIIIGTIALAFTYSRAGIICYYIIALLFAGLCISKRNYKDSIFIILVVTLLYFIPGQSSIINSTISYANIKVNKIIEKIKPASNNTNSNTSKPQNGGNSSSKPSNTTPKPTPTKPASTEHLDASSSSRDSFDRIAIAFIKKYTYTGIGIGNYNYVIKNQNFNNYIDINLSKNTEYRYSHNMFLYMFVEIGAIGLSIFITMLTYLFVQMIRNKNLLLAIVFTAIFILTAFFEPIIYMRDIAPMFVIMYTFITKKSYDSNS